MGLRRRHGKYPPTPTGNLGVYGKIREKSKGQMIESTLMHLLWNIERHPAERNYHR